MTNKSSAIFSPGETIDDSRKADEKIIRTRKSKELYFVIHGKSSNPKYPHYDEQGMMARKPPLNPTRTFPMYQDPSIDSGISNRKQTEGIIQK